MREPDEILEIQGLNNKSKRTPSETIKQLCLSQRSINDVEGDFEIMTEDEALKELESYYTPDHNCTTAKMAERKHNG